MVQRSVKELLVEMSEDKMDRLPSGVSIYSLLRTAEEEEGEVVNASMTRSIGTDSPNALIQILSRVSPEDLLALQKGVRVASASYRYYQYNSSIGTAAADIPTR